MKKVLPIILYSIVILAAGGLLVYYGLVEKTLESGDLIKGLLIIAAALIGMLRPRRNRTVVSKKATYQKAYAEFIQNAFSNDRKSEKKLYNAIHDYNRNRPSAAIATLEKLRPQCHRTSDLRAVTVFHALCLDDMGLYKKAIEQYDAAIQMHPSSTLYSNMGLCYQRLGQPDAAVTCYQNAILQDSNNAIAHNNLASHYFQQGEYAEALRCSKNAIAIDAKMHQALSCAAVCCALLGEETEYKKYYRQAVAAGYDGNTIKRTITNLNPDL